MSTRALVHIESNDKPLLTLYWHSDGYPEGAGKDLAEFLNGFEIVNGITDYSKKIANGMPCLAAQIVAKFKDGPGQLYIYPLGSKDCGEEFMYRIRNNPAGVAGRKAGLWMEVWDVSFDGTKKLLCDGPMADILTAIPKLEEIE